MTQQPDTLDRDDSFYTNPENLSACAGVWGRVNILINQGYTKQDAIEEVARQLNIDRYKASIMHLSYCLSQVSIPNFKGIGESPTYES